jgi:hypothetical protein
MGITGGEAKKFFVINGNTKEERDRTIPAYGNLRII